MSKPSLLAWEQGVDNRFNTSVDQLFEDLAGNTEQGDGTIALWVLYRFVWLWDRFLRIANSTKTQFINVGLQQLYVVDVERDLAVLLVRESVFIKILMKGFCL